jgi:hypothetical protein
VCESGSHVLIEIDAAVGEFAEGSLLLELGGLFGILYRSYQCLHYGVGGVSRT